MSVVIKQYGELRTGTNYVRALLQQNYPEALVLTYILGDKHSPPVDFDAIWRDVASLPDADVEFVRRATYAVRGPASHEGDLTQLAEIRKRASAIAAAYRDGTMRFLVTIKDPYAWIVSVARFRQWVHDDVETLHDWDREPVREFCERYNRNYAAWQRLVESTASRADFVRHEDLLDGAENAFARLQRSLGLQPERPFADIPEQLEPSVWDHLPVEKSGTFDAAYYAERRYLRRLRQDHMDIISATIDWPALGRFGYRSL